jgi:CSLREA domain-containing protein
MAFGVPGAAAATLKVNTTIDSASPGRGLCSLREAVQAVDSPGSSPGGCAPASFGTNTIVLGRRTYDLRAPNGELAVTPQVTSLTITGAGEDSTVINATGLDDRVLEIRAGANVTISDLTITGGHASAGTAGTAGAGYSISRTAGGAGGNGGAILNAGTLTVLDAAVMNSGPGATGCSPPRAQAG